MKINKIAILDNDVYALIEETEFSYKLYNTSYDVIKVSKKLNLIHIIEKDFNNSALFDDYEKKLRVLMNQSKNRFDLLDKFLEKYDKFLPFIEVKYKNKQIVIKHSKDYIYTSVCDFNVLDFTYVPKYKIYLDEIIMDKINQLLGI